MNLSTYLSSKTKIIVVAFLLMLSNAYAQQKNVQFTAAGVKDKAKLEEALAEIKLGDELFALGNRMYPTAIVHYLKANEINPNNDDLNLKIATCLLESKRADKTKAVPYIEKAYELNKNVSPYIHYYLGRAYHITGQWQKAKVEYSMYKKKLRGKEDGHEITDVEKKISECDNGIELSKNPSRVFIDNIGNVVNSTESEYQPVISADEAVLLFTSRRNNSTGGQKDETEQFFEDVYISYKFNNDWGKPSNVGKPINTPGHDAVIGLSPDGQKLYLYIDTKGDGNIYECEASGDGWSKPSKLPKPINTEATESSATVSFDGKTLYFVSNRDGGLGAKDIYMCTKNSKGKWGEAVNLGPTVNTPYSEESVFMLPDGKTLYFSSQGHNSIGELDIFKTVFENGKWSTPQNVGVPVNTPDNDVFFVMSANGKHGYYSSAREGGVGNVDLYMVTFLGPEREVVINTEDNLLANQLAPVAASSEVKKGEELNTSTQLTILKGIITDAKTKKVLEAQIEIVDNELNEVVASFPSNSKTGKYLVSLPSGKNYGIAVKKQGYLFHSENFDIPVGAGYQEITKDVALDKVEVGSKIVLNNIFFDVDKFSLRPASIAELERLTQLMIDEPTIKIEISGHTDNTGSAPHNLTLSDNRAKAVVDYLVKKGIKKERMVAKGYGLTKPVADNTTDEGRQMNRRTEFEILSK